jgi:hypothetical protein
MELSLPYYAISIVIRNVLFQRSSDDERGRGESWYTLPESGGPEEEPEPD